MPHISELLEQLQQDFHEYRFEPYDCFKWVPTEATIGYCITPQTNQAPGSASSADPVAAQKNQPLTPRNAADCFDLLHELAHAQLAHAHYRFDVELLRQESSAWQLAALTLGPRYDVVIADEYVQECLDTYRDWLYSRSACPNCAQTGLQSRPNAYTCVNCSQVWKVNDARQCALRRFVVL